VETASSNLGASTLKGARRFINTFRRGHFARVLKRKSGAKGQVKYLRRLQNNIPKKGSEIPKQGTGQMLSRRLAAF